MKSAKGKRVFLSFQDIATIENAFYWNRINRENIWDEKHYNPLIPGLHKSANEHFKDVIEAENAVLEKL